VNFDVTIEIPEGQRMAHRSDIADVSEFELLEIQHFFEVYKELEPGKEVEAARWVGAAEALAEIDDCRKRLAGSEGGHP
jgi:inorganic pyrophosphatase